MLPVERGSGEQKSNLLCAAGELGETALGGGTADISAAARKNAQKLLRKLLCVRAHRWCVFSSGEGGNCVCVFMQRAYLMTAAALAAFSSACCCKSFHLTFHAENEKADEPRRKPTLRDQITASSVSATLEAASLKCRSPARVKKSCFLSDLEAESSISLCCSS